MPIENVVSKAAQNAVDRWLDEQPDEKAPRREHPLDKVSAKKKQNRLMEWYTQERERQAANRYQQAIDEDYYDNLQWDEQEALELMERGQAPLVYNETATTLDWILGTEKRTRVDFKVLPRAEDDVDGADAKTKALKYLGDVNRVAFARSLAFGDAVKAGIGWLEDGARDDPTDEPVFSRRESWRNMFWDSLAKERDLSDARYLFRVRHVDVDIAEAMFPDRVQKIRSASNSADLWGNEEDEDFWYLGKHFTARDEMGEAIGRRTYVSDVALVNNRRARVKLIEAWYRLPTIGHYCNGGEFEGKRFDAKNEAMLKGLKLGRYSLYDRLEMRVWCAVMTENDLLQDVQSPYRHNRFPFTPIWCYRRARDGMPYGPARRFRDVQDDLNKRASKALYALSTNRVIADHDAFEDHDEAREEAGRPDAYLIKKRGTELSIENNYNMAQGHMELMDRDERMIQKVGGVTDDNLGRRTNAVSGEAIRARQLQGSVVTAEIFDNLRFAIQCQGEIQLSLAEQFMSEPKVLRVIGARGKIDWLKINQPEEDAEGNVRYLNDITARQADFVVGEQDFHESVRAAMFETMTDLVGRIAQVNPEAGLRILRMALEFSDLPNKEEMAAEVKQLLGIVDEEEVAKMTPEQRAEFEKQKAQRQEAQEIQRQASINDAREKAAQAAKIEAEATLIAAEAQQIGAQADGGVIAEAQVAKVQAEAEQRVLEAERRAAEAVDAARQEIERLQQQANDKKYQVDAEQRTKVEIARINAAATARSDQSQARLQTALDRLGTELAELKKRVGVTGKSKTGGSDAKEK